MGKKEIWHCYCNYILFLPEAEIQNLYYDYVVFFLSHHLCYRVKNYLEYEFNQALKIVDRTRLPQKKCILDFVRWQRVCQQCNQKVQRKIKAKVENKLKDCYKKFVDNIIQKMRKNRKRLNEKDGSDLLFLWSRIWKSDGLLIIYWKRWKYISMDELKTNERISRKIDYKIGLRTSKIKSKKNLLTVWLKISEDRWKNLWKRQMRFWT